MVIRPARERPRLNRPFLVGAAAVFAVEAVASAGVAIARTPIGGRTSPTRSRRRERSWSRARVAAAASACAWRDADLVRRR